MTRLNKEMKLEARDRMMTHMHMEKAEALRAQAAELALRILEYTTKDHAQAMSKVPEFFFAKANAIKVVFNEKNFQHLAFNGYLRDMWSIWRFMGLDFNSTVPQVEFRVPACLLINNDSDTVRISAEHPNAVEFEKLQQAAASLAEEMRQDHLKIESILSKIRTLKSLAAFWPEAKEFFPGETAAVREMVDVSAISRKLRPLPSELEAA